MLLPTDWNNLSMHIVGISMQLGVYPNVTNDVERVGVAALRIVGSAHDELSSQLL